MRTRHDRNGLVCGRGRHNWNVGQSGVGGGFFAIVKSRPRRTVGLLRSFLFVLGTRKRRQSSAQTVSARYKTCPPPSLCSPSSWLRLSCHPPLAFSTRLLALLPLPAFFESKGIMFARVFKSAVIVSVVAFFAIARGVPTSTGNGQCNNGGMKCCNQVINVRLT